jgi:hypothetical protein
MAQMGKRRHNAHENAHRKTLYADQMARRKARVRKFAEACKERAVARDAETPFFVINHQGKPVVYRVSEKRAKKIASRTGGTIEASLEAGKATPEIVAQWKKDLLHWKVQHGYRLA